MNNKTFGRLFVDIDNNPFYNIKCLICHIDNLFSLKFGLSQKLNCQNCDADLLKGR